ncbi:putative recombination initiation defect 1 [Actinidia rufa]|uniref:Putative recombination initiation defect 1 n=1 Tax=Actinidia rufa TaxID=165716 RepID=A0A7J0E7R0_9ERIC|nr:putative recombination initiation defect 1 [Actinidia rufa]
MHPPHPHSFEFEPTCSQGHRSSLSLETLEGGSICLLCLSNLISDPKSPTFHVSYALSQLSHAIAQPDFLRQLLTFHPHFLVSPLVDALSCFDDEPIARQLIDLVSVICDLAGNSVCGEFVTRIACRLSSGELAWSRRQVYTLHCLGILLGYKKNNLYSHISDKDALVFNLVTGLQLPSEEIRGEILFVLYKISILQYSYKDDDATDVLYSFCPKLLYLSLEALTKTQSDDVRLNCLGCKDPAVSSCLQVLDLLSTAEQVFIQRFAIGFSTLVPALRYVAEIPFHPVQAQTLKLIWNCVSNCPGLVSTSHIEDLGLILTGMLKKYTDREAGMLTEIFSLACSILVAIMKSPSSHATSNFSTSVQDASRHAILACLSNHGKYFSQLMYSLYLLKEAYTYSHKGNSTSSTSMELRNCILSVCKTNLLPWFVTAIGEMEEDIVLGVLETFHSILLQDSDIQATEFANILVSSSCFSFTFGCLGLFPTEKMKWRVFLLFSSIVDVLFGNDIGQPIRDAALHLPSDPVDLLFLLGQKSSNNLDLSSCQSAILLILYTSSLYDDRLADEKLVLASLEQYLLVNSSEFLYEVADSVPVELLINLYSLYRGLAKKSYQISYSPEAERILFNLVTEKEWDLPSASIHPTSLKWLFQQEKICIPLTHQILKLCRSNSSCINQIIVHGNSSQSIEVHTIAEFVASDDNFAATLVVHLLKELVEEHEEHDIISVLRTVEVIIDHFSIASDQLCLHGICPVIQSLYCYEGHFSPQLFMVICKVTFSILHSVHSKSLSDDEAWVAITMKLRDYLVSTVATDVWTEESLIVIGILSLILHHSTNQALVETSKTILLSTPLFSAFNNTIHAACSKGPALIDHGEGTKVGETLLFVTLLLFFSLRRLMYFGSAPVKLVASYCLLELFIRISNQKNEKSENLNCTTRYVLSIMPVLEMLVFDSDIRVAMNCSLCLSMILGWENLDLELRANRRNNWCRLIVEELAMSLAAPCLASESFMIHHKPAIHVAVALLKLHKVPEWMSSVFDDSCISGIVNNLSSSNVSAEMVLLFRELMNAHCLKDEHVATLNRVFQACRKHQYTHANEGEEHMEEVNVPDDKGKVCWVLINIMSSQTSLGMNCCGSSLSSNRLLEEIEMFSKSLMEEDS